MIPNERFWIPVVIALSITIVIIVSVLNYLRGPSDIPPIDTFVSSDINILVGARVLSESQIKVQSTTAKVITLAETKADILARYKKFEKGKPKEPTQCKTLDDDINNYLIARTDLRLELVKKHLYLKCIIAGIWSRAVPDLLRAEHKQFNPESVLFEVCPDGREIKNINPLIITPGDIKRWFHNFDAKFGPPEHLHLQPGKKIVVQASYVFVENYGHSALEANPNSSLQSIPEYSLAAADQDNQSVISEASAMPTMDPTTLTHIEEYMVALVADRHAVRSLHHVLINSDRKQTDCDRLTALINVFIRNREAVRLKLVEEHIKLKCLIITEWNKGSPQGKKTAVPDVKNLYNQTLGKGNKISNTTPLCLLQADVQGYVNNFKGTFGGISSLSLGPDYPKVHVEAVESVRTPVPKFKDLELQRFTSYKPTDFSASSLITMEPCRANANTNLLSRRGVLPQEEERPLIATTLAPTMFTNFQFSVNTVRSDAANVDDVRQNNNSEEGTQNRLESDEEGTTKNAKKIYRVYTR